MYDRVFSMKLPRTSQEMASLCRRSSAASSNPDLVFFQTRGNRISHVGIFVGNDTLYTPLSPKASPKTSSSRTTTTNDTPEPSVCSTTSSPTCLLFPSNRKALFCQTNSHPESIVRAALYFFRFYCPILPDYAFRNKCLRTSCLRSGRSVSLRISMFRAKNQTSSCVSR